MNQKSPRKWANFHLAARRRRRLTANAVLPGWQMALLDLALLAAVAGSMGFDRLVSRAVVGADLAIVRWLNVIEDFGNSKWVLVPAICWLLAIWLARRYMTSERRLAASLWLLQALSFVIATVAVSGITANLLKRIFGRARPRALEDHLTADWTFLTNNSHFQSFPSGHATTSLAAMIALAMLFPGLRYPLVIIGILGAVARVTVGAHFPSDILAGGIWGGLFAWWFAQYFAARNWAFTQSSGRPVLSRTAGSAIRDLFAGGKA